MILPNFYILWKSYCYFKFLFKLSTLEMSFICSYLLIFSPIEKFVFIKNCSKFNKLMKSTNTSIVNLICRDLARERKIC